MPKRKSWVWKHFSQMKNEYAVMCKFCSRILQHPSGNTTNMAYHLLKVHNITKDEVSPPVRKKCSPPSCSTVQPPLNSSSVQQVDEEMNRTTLEDSQCNLQSVQQKKNDHNLENEISPPVRKKCSPPSCSTVQPPLNSSSVQQVDEEMNRTTLEDSQCNLQSVQQKRNDHNLEKAAVGFKMFNASNTQESFEHYAYQGSVLHFLVISEEEQAILDNIPGWTVESSTDENQGYSCALEHRKNSELQQPNVNETRPKEMPVSNESDISNNLKRLSSSEPDLLSSTAGQSIHPIRKLKSFSETGNSPKHSEHIQPLKPVSPLKPSTAGQSIHPIRELKSFSETGNSPKHSEHIQPLKPVSPLKPSTAGQSIHPITKLKSFSETSNSPKHSEHIQPLKPVSPSIHSNSRSITWTDAKSNDDYKNEGRISNIASPKQICITKVPESIHEHDPPLSCKKRTTNNDLEIFNISAHTVTHNYVQNMQEAENSLYEVGEETQKACLGIISNEFQPSMTSQTVHDGSFLPPSKNCVNLNDKTTSPVVIHVSPISAKTRKCQLVEDSEALPCSSELFDTSVQFSCDFTPAKRKLIFSQESSGIMSSIVTKHVSQEISQQTRSIFKFTSHEIQKMSNAIYKIYS